MLNVLFACRSQIFEVPGGDTVQLLKMQQYLQTTANVEVTISPDPTEICREKYDLVHAFNLFDIDSLEPQVAAAKRCGLPVLLTTNYWNPLEFFFETSHSLFHQIARSLLPRQFLFDRYCRQKRNRMQSELERQRKVLEAASLILPNSVGEGCELQRDFGLPSEKVSVVYNAVDFDDIAAADAESFTAEYGMKDFVLCVGRFEERKNQLGVIKALAGLNAPLVFIGGVPPYQRPYFEACQKAARRIPKVLFLAGLPQKSVFAAMKAAKAHVLGSWWENTGLVSLEAAVCGCNVVSTNRSPWQEYFADDAWIINPADPASIRQAVEAAVNSPVSNALAERIRERFTWSQAAADLAKAYQRVLEKQI